MFAGCMSNYGVALLLAETCTEFLLANFAGQMVSDSSGDCLLSVRRRTFNEKRKRSVLSAGVSWVTEGSHFSLPKIDLWHLANDILYIMFRRRVWEKQNNHIFLAHGVHFNYLLAGFFSAISATKGHLSPFAPAP